MPLAEPALTNPDTGTGPGRVRGDQLMRGRKFNAGELQLMLLWLLRDGPAHGYELARRLGELSRGYYSPSPGVMYPALAQLEAQSFAQVERDGRRKNYRITPAGLEHARLHAGRAEQLLAILKHAAKKMLWMRQIGEGEAAASEATGWLPEYVRAGDALRTALMMQDDADHAEQRRIIAILQRAAADILQGAEDQ